ncbi:MAG: hypothetical protein HY736_15105 [Verrucomicrobia bacterium]|nr:hypothetical protein [Verrucomicrobiota bacterium]
MIHHRKGLPLRLEACDHLARIHARLDHFQGDLPPDRLLLFGHPDDPAAAFAEPFEELVPADPDTGVFLRRRQAYGGQVGRQRGPDGDGRLKQAPGHIVGGEQSGEVGAQRVIAAARLIEEGAAFGRGPRERVGKERLFARKRLAHGGDAWNAEGEPPRA